MHPMPSELAGNLHRIRPNLVGSFPVSRMEFDMSLLSDAHSLDILSMLLGSVIDPWSQKEIDASDAIGVSRRSSLDTGELGR
jgi:hypothetical protein